MRISLLGHLGPNYSQRGQARQDTRMVARLPSQTYHLVFIHYLGGDLLRERRLFLGRLCARSEGGHGQCRPQEWRQHHGQVGR